MHAVIQIGSSQHKVTEGDLIDVNKVQESESKDFTIDKVLYYEDGADVRFGQPFLKGAKVTAKITKNFRGKKLVAFKFRRRKGYKKTIGHRQELTQLKIVKISV